MVFRKPEISISIARATFLDKNAKKTSKKYFFFQAEDGIQDSVASRGLGDVYKRQAVVAAFRQQDFQPYHEIAVHFLRVNRAALAGLAP